MFVSLVLGVAGGRDECLEVLTSPYLWSVFDPFMLHHEVKVYRLNMSLKIG